MEPGRLVLDRSAILAEPTKSWESKIDCLAEVMVAFTRSGIGDIPSAGQQLVLRLERPSVSGLTYVNCDAERVEHAREERYHAGPKLRLESQLVGVVERSEEHTSELQSRSDLVCRLL